MGLTARANRGYSGYNKNSDSSTNYSSSNNIDNASAIVESAGVNRMKLPSNNMQVKDPRFTSTLGGGAKKNMPALDLSKISFPPRNIPRPQGPSPLKIATDVNNPLLSQSDSLSNTTAGLYRKESIYDINPITDNAIRPFSNKSAVKSTSHSSGSYITEKKSQPLGASLGALDHAYSPPKSISVGKTKKPPPPS